jgi:hypothetical protein
MPVVETFLKRASRVNAATRAKLGAQNKREDVEHDWEEFLTELRAVDYDESEEARGRAQGAEGTLHRLVSMVYVHDGVKVADLFNFWLFAKAQRETQARRQRAIDASLPVQVWRGSRFAQKERIPVEEVDRPWAPGTVLIEQDPHVTSPLDPNAPPTDVGPLLGVRTLRVGVALDAGTVVAKRLLFRAEGTRAQYLLKPTS